MPTPTLDSLTTALRSRLLALKGLRSVGAMAREAGVSRTTLNNFLHAATPLSRHSHARLEAWAAQQESK